MTHFTPIESTLGGLLIGLSAVLMLLLNGRIAGISGILGGLFDRSSGARGWRATFVLGLLLGGLGTRMLAPQAFGAAPVALPLVIVAGLLVGFGTRLGSGCTSGHGVCGLSRMSPRSLVSTLTFMTAGAAAVYAVRHVFGV